MLSTRWDTHRLSSTNSEKFSRITILVEATVILIGDMKTYLCTTPTADSVLRESALLLLA